MNLKEFLKKYGTNTTSNFDLMKMAEELKIPNFHVCMRDELPKVRTESKPYSVVVNIHTSNEKGVHWSCFTPKYFFDSYGLPPTEEVRDIMKHGEYNTFKLQVPGTKLCGQLSMFVLYQLNKNVPFLDILFQIRDHLQRERSS